MNTVFLTNNLIEQANFSVSLGTPQNGRFNLNNIKHNFTTKTARVTGNNVKIVIDLGHTATADTFCITGSKIDGLGFTSIALKGSPTTDFSSSISYPVTISHKYNFGFISFPESSFRYWELELTGDDFVELSNMFLGVKTHLIKNGISHNTFEFGYRELSKVATNDFNNRFVDEYPTIKFINGTMKTLTESEYDTIRELKSIHRTTKPLWFLLDPEGNMPETDSEWLYSGYFRFTSAFSAKMSGRPGVYDINVNLEEIV